MISIEQATEIVLANTIELPTISVDLNHAIGHQLREDLYADRDFPPFHRVTMDGIAIYFDFLKKGQRTFKIEGIQAAGAPQQAIASPENCMEVMTGAVLPHGLDTVIRYEDITIQDGVATINIDSTTKQKNVHHQGTDRTKGSLIVKSGGIISPAEIGVAATVGKSTLQVSKLPKVAIIATGDELVEVQQTPAPHQIRTSNVYTIASLLGKHHISADFHHIVDDKATTYQRLQQCLDHYDVLLLSGGVSKGKYDYVPEVLEQLAVKKLFHRVKQRPGKPFWFGKSPLGKIVFALPGNPVSSFMCTNRYFLPWLRASMGHSPFPYPYAILTQDFYFKPNLQYFLQVKISYNTTGTILAHPVEGKGSGDLANLVDADGFLELPADRTEFKKGEVFRFIAYR